jgi:putrescine transport system ATP-binding protein
VAVSNNDAANGPPGTPVGAPRVHVKPARLLTSGEAYVRLDAVTKRYGDTVAVNAVSLEIHKGEIFCLLGGSGCGKTTLLRMLAGFERPSSGALYIDGQDIAGIPPYERPVNMMFQSYALFPHMTVGANISFGLEQEGLGRAEIEQRVAEILDIVKLGPYAKRKPHQLSGGQRQRVALARSLVKRPKLLLLDEPLGALDRKLREHTQFELISIQESLGVTFVVVTHDQEEAMTLATRVGVMNRGEIVQVGTPRQIYEFPATRFVADFIGSVNLFEGQLTEDEPDHVRVNCPELPAPVYVDHGMSAAPAADCWVAVRPEKIDLCRTQPEGADNWAHGVIHNVAYMGDMSVYLIRLDSGRDVRVTQANRTRKPEEQFTWDEAVYLCWDVSSPVVGVG